MEETNYTKLAAINVNEKIEKKNNLSYLSWAWAVDQLLRADPNATWIYQEPVRWNETVMVFCTVTAFGKAMTAQLPVMDYKNKAISNPDAFSVNTAMQRCLAKAIALHGLGLYIYAGEDVPESEKGDSEPEDKKPKGKPESAKTVSQVAWEAEDEESKKYLSELAQDVQGLLGMPDVKMAVEKLEEAKLSADEKVAIWYLFDSKERAAMKAYSDNQRAAQ